MMDNNNWQMLGHDWAVELLRGQLRRGAPRHAYMFTGASGLGRRTLALRFAQAINAENPTAPGDFDPTSRTSQQFERMQHPDLTVVTRQENARDLKIDAIRELQHTLSLSPYVAKSRIALLLNFEEANASASNALLKTLEEPPGRAVLLLTATNPETLLPTIVSRCELIRLRPLPLTTVAAGLQSNWQVPAEQAQLLSHLSGGRPGYALHLHQNPELLEQRNLWLDEQHQLLSANRVNRFTYAEQLAKNKEDFGNVVQVWLSYWRDIMLQASQAAAPLTNLDRSSEINQLANQIGAGRARHMVTALETTLSILRANVNLRLAAEVLLLDMPKL